MKINQTQFIPELNRNLAPIYLLSSDEPSLILDAKKSFYHKAAQHEFNHREILHMESNTDWQTFYTLAYNLSLFTTKQIIELRFTQAKPGTTGSKLLIEYATNPPPDNILLLIMPKIDAATQKSQWFKTMEQKAVVVQFWPPERNQLPSWIVNKAQQLGLRINLSCAKILAEHTAGNLLATQQELEKMALLHSSATITEEQLINMLSDNARFNSFDLIDALYLPQNTAQIINILEHLKAEEYEPTLILWTITREIRLLINCKIANNDPLLLDKCLNSGSYKIKNERKNQIKKLIGKISLQYLEKMLCLAGDVDQMIKGVKPGDVWHHLQKLVNLIAIS